jgi:quercetin 2,3-dioxygenase
VNTQFPSQIFKSNLRGCEETVAYKCLSTFNFKNYKNEFRAAFGQLKFVNDEFLSPQQSVTFRHNEDVRVVLIPLKGAITCSENTKGLLIQSEQVKAFEAEKGLTYSFSNPYENEWINYLHIGFQANGSPYKHESSLSDIEFKKINSLVPLGFNNISEDQLAGHIGIYQSRSKENYTLKNPGNGVFVYVINGAFDVHGRLLEYRDGLSLWDTQKIEFEALSDNAIILLFEINLDSKHINNN